MHVTRFFGSIGQKCKGRLECPRLLRRSTSFVLGSSSGRALESRLVTLVAVHGNLESKLEGLRGQEPLLCCICAAEGEPMAACKHLKCICSLGHTHVPLVAPPFCLQEAAYPLKLQQGGGASKQMPVVEAVE